MKLINNAAIGVCLFLSVSAEAQQTDSDTTTQFTPPVIVQDKDSVQKSEDKKEEYKSEEWRQGTVQATEIITDTTNRSAQKHKSGTEKKTKKRVPSPPPPPLAPPPPVRAKP